MISRWDQTRKRMNDMKSFALCVMMGAHSEPDHLDTAAITAPKMKISTAFGADSVCSAIQPGTWRMSTR